MAEVTPRGMLTLFRQQSDPFTAGQIKLFLAMPAAERMELLFLMSLHTNAMLQRLHAQVDPAAAVTSGMPDPETMN